MRLSTAALGLVLTACYSNGEGITPPLGRIYFPVGLTTDCDARAGAPADCQAKRLYVASSDFDLQYNSGSLQVLRLDGEHGVRQLVANLETNNLDCRSILLDPQSPADQVLVPGPCHAVELENATPQNPEPLLVSAVGIGAFATDVVLTTLENEQAPGEFFKRLLVPVRGEASLHWIDIAPDAPDPKDEMDCGQDSSASSPSCDRVHRVGTDPAANTRQIKMPAEPFSVAVSAEGDAIVVTHQTTGQLSLFHQDVRDSAAWKSHGPTLEALYQLPAYQAVAIAAAPEPEIVRRARWDWLHAPEEQAGVPSPDPYPPGFLVAYASEPQLDLVRFYADGESSPERPFILGTASIPIRANSTDRVSRGVTFDDTNRRQCDLNCDTGAAAANAACNSGDPNCVSQAAGQLDTCLAVCAQKAVGVYVSSRSPASLLVGSTIPGTPSSPARDIPTFLDAFSMPIGPSRVYVGKIVNEVGELETRVFAVCFDQRRIAIYDPKRNIPEEIITTGRGPHAMAFDFSPGDPGDPSTARALAYVGHFTDSYIGVIELDRRKIRTYGNIVLSLATAIAPRASK